MPLETIRKNGQLGVLAVDLTMVLLLLVNLLWIVFDWSFQIAAVQTLLSDLVPRFSRFYADRVAPHFFRYDLVFVAVFLTEFLIRWVMAAVRRRHHRWFFFPFVHWYDLLGLVPVAGFRALRLLRVISIALRLQRVGAIDITKQPVVRFFIKYYRVLIQELTDRVTVNIIARMQSEVRHGGSMVDHIVDDVIVPRQDQLVEWLSHRIEHVVEANYTRYRSEIQRYVRIRLNDALRRSKDFSRLEKVPMVGPMVRSAVEDAVSDIVFHVANGILQDLASDRNRALVGESVEVAFEALIMKESDSALSSAVVETVDEALEIVKKQISIQQWRLRDSAADEEEFRRMLRDELKRLAAVHDT